MMENELETTQPNNQEEETQQEEAIQAAVPAEETTQEVTAEDASLQEGASDASEAPAQDAPQAAEAGQAQGQDPNWYQQFIEDYAYELPQRGQVIEGNIMRIDSDAVIVDVGLKRDAIVPSRDLSQLSSEYLKSLHVGDKVIVYVISPPVGDQDLLVSLSKGIEHESWEHAEQHLEGETLLELEVVGYNKGGLLVSFENLRGFVPASQIPDLRRIGDRQRSQKIKQDLVGTTLAVKPIEVNRQRNRLVFSARAAQDEQRHKRLRELEKGQIFLQTRVASVVDFGVFVDLGGVDGLVHISELDWKMVKHPSDLFKSGDEIDVQVIDVDVERERISLSRKALLPNPWHSLEDRFKPGDVIQGRVTRLMDFGAFVEVADGVEGLVHISELGYSSAGKPEEVVATSDTVLVRVLDIDIGRERLSLSMRRVPIEKQMAWMAEAYTGSKAAGEQAEPPVEEAPEDAVEVEAQGDEAPVEAEPSAQVEAETLPAEEPPADVIEGASAAEAEEEPEAQVESETPPAAEPSAEVAEDAPDAQAEAEPPAEVADVAPDAQTEAETSAEVSDEAADAQAEAEPPAEVADVAPDAQTEAEPSAQVEVESAAPQQAEADEAEQEAVEPVEAVSEAAGEDEGSAEQADEESVDEKDEA